MLLAIPPFGQDLAAGLRELLAANGEAARIELAPQSPFAGDPEFLSDDLSDWTILNGSAATIDANTARDSRLAIAANTDASLWFAGGRSGPYVYQEIDGDFDVYGLFSSGPVATGAFNNGGFMLQSPSDESDWLECGFEVRSGGCHRIVSTVDGGSTEYITYSGNLDDNDSGFMGEHGLVRVQRVGDDFTIYAWDFEVGDWVTIKAITRADFPSTIRVGVVQYGNGGAGNRGYVTCDFLRDWPPYLTTSPTADVVIDSGADDTEWDMSTFLALANAQQEYSPQAQIGLGSLTYQYGAGNSDPPALNGSDLTEAEMQAEDPPTGRYFRLQTKFVSATGAEQASFQGAVIDALVVADIDYPAEGDVQAGVSYDNGNLTGTLALPAVGDVQAGVQYGAAGTEFTGTFAVPAAGDVQSGVQYGAAGTEFTGSFAVPVIGNVRADVQYGAGGTEFTGNLVLPDVDDVTFATPFGANASEFSGTFVIPAEGDVQFGVDYGGGDQSFTGNLELPAEGDVRDGIQYGANGTEFEGTFEGGGGPADYPAESDVRLGVSYDDGDLVGTLVLPAEGNVREGIQFGAAGTEFTGTLFVPGSLPAADTIVDLADAVAATLTALVQTNGGEVSRKYVPRLDLEKMADTLFASVVPNSFQSERQDRGSFTRDLAIDVAIQKRVGEDLEATDALVALVDQAADILWQTPRLAGCTLLNVQVRPVFAPDHLVEKGVFTSVLQATYRQGRSLS